MLLAGSYTGTGAVGDNDWSNGANLGGTEPGAFAASGLRDGVYYVAKGDPQTVTTTIEFSHMEVHDNLTVTGSGVLKKTGSEPDLLAPDAGDDATITILQSGCFSFASGCRSMQIGAGNGRIVYDSWYGEGRPMPVIDISPEATATDGYIDVLEIKQTMPALATITNRSTNTARVLFTGTGVSGLADWGMTHFVSPTDANKFELVGSAGHSIRFGRSGWYPFFLTNRDNVLATAGECDFVLDKADSNDPTRNNMTRLTLNKTISWNHTGDFISSNVVVYCEKDDVLPHGPQTGIIRLWTRAYEYTVAAEQGKLPYFGMIDLQGTKQSINGLDTTERGCLYNSSTKQAVVTVGENDADVTIRGLVMGNVLIRKVGSGKLTVREATIPALEINGGTLDRDQSSVIDSLEIKLSGDLTIPAGSTVAALALGRELTPIAPTVAGDTAEPFAVKGWLYYYREEKGALDATRVYADCGILDAPPLLSVAAGGALALNSAEDQVLERLKFDVAGTLRKQGGGKTVIRDSAAAPQRFSGLIHAADGTFAFAGMGITNEWWRLTVTKRRGGGALNTMCLHEWGLFDADGNRLNKGIGKGPTDLQESDDMSSMANGKVTWSSDLQFQDTSHDIDNMFDGTWYNWAAITGTASGVTPDKIVIAIRLKAGQNPVHSYAFSDKGETNIPTSWKIETSPDGKNWTTVDEKTDYYSASDRGKDLYYYYWWNDKRWGASFGLPLTFGYANEEPSDVDVAGARVRADAGATVDLTGTKGALAGIEYDATACGGTVRAFRAAPNGTLALTGLTRKQAKGEIDLALPAATDVENFATWKVTVDGEPVRRGVSYDASTQKLTLMSPGLMLIVR